MGRRATRVNGRVPPEPPSSRRLHGLCRQSHSIPSAGSSNPIETSKKHVHCRAPFTSIGIMAAGCCLSQVDSTITLAAFGCNSGFAQGSRHAPPRKMRNRKSTARSQLRKPLIPTWDSVRRELRVGVQVVKRFHNPAPVQELILAAFEEEGWPPHIDDPLPPCDGIDPKKRLHNAINCLNRNRAARLIKFHGNGTRTGVRWDFGDIFRSMQCDVE